MDLIDFASFAFISKMSMNTANCTKEIHAGSTPAKIGYTGGYSSGQFKNKQEV